MSKIYFNAYILLAATFLVASCSSLRKTVDHGHTSQISINQLSHSIDTSRIDFHAFSAKFSCDLVSNEINQSLKGNLRIIHDSAIWISVTPGLGIEAARLLLTRDSIFLLNRLKSTYIKEKFSEIKQLLNIDVDFSVIESVLTNKFFIYPSISTQSVANQNFNLSIKSKEYQLEKVSNDILTKFSVDPIYLLFYSLVSLEKQKISMEANYSDFKLLENHQFPFVSEINISKLEKIFKIKLEYLKIEVNQQLEFPFRIPESYKQAKL